MRISSAQIAAFAPAARARFEAEMFAHLQGYAPELTRVAGDDALRKIVHAGVDRAARYGFTQRGPVQFFLELMLSFGHDFDTDPQYAAFHPALRERELDQMARAITLHSGVRRYFDLVSGPGDRFAVAAMARLQSLAASADLDRWQDVPTTRLMVLCREVYPEKYAYVGQSALGELFAPCYPPHPAALPPDTRPVVALLMYGFGAGVLSDPLYPWVRQTVRDVSSKDLAERLKRRATLYLAEVLNVYRRTD